MALAAVCLTLPALAQTAPQRSHSATMRRPAAMGYLGVGVTALTDDRVKALGLKDNRGLEVRHVAEESPAAKAGVKEGDVITELNGKPIDDVEQFIRAVAETEPGTKVKLAVLRNGAKQEMTATLRSRTGNLFVPMAPEAPDAPMPPMPPMPPVPGASGDGPMSLMMGDSPRVGFEGEMLSPQLADYFGVKEGVLVRTVIGKTPAEKAGLKAGDVVVKVNGNVVRSPRDITGEVRAGGNKTLTFTVVRNRKEITLHVEIASAEPAHREAL